MTRVLVFANGSNTRFLCSSVFANEGGIGVFGVMLAGVPWDGTSGNQRIREQVRLSKVEYL